MDKSFILALSLTIFSIVWFTGGTTYFLIALSQNETGSNATLPTGQEPVQIENTEGQIVEAAPADSIIDLFNYILVVAIPAVVALAGTIITIIRQTGIGKKYEKQLVIAENGIKYIDTMAPKVKEQISDSGFAKIGYEVLMGQIDRIKPGAKQEIEAEIQTKMPEITGKVKEATEQIQEFHDRIPKEWYADKDDNIPRPFTQPARKGK